MIKTMGNIKLVFSVSSHSLLLIFGGMGKIG